MDSLQLELLDGHRFEVGERNSTWRVGFSNDGLSDHAAAWEWGWSDIIDAELVGKFSPRGSGARLLAFAFGCRLSELHLLLVQPCELSEDGVVVHLVEGTGNGRVAARTTQTCRRVLRKCTVCSGEAGEG